MNRHSAGLEHAFRLLQQQRLVEAQAACSAVLARAPLNPEALHLLGLIRKQMGDAAGAEKLLRQSIDLQPRRAEFRANLGNLLRARGDLAAARDSYRRALELDPRHSQARVGLIRTLNDLGEHAAAETESRKGLSANGKDAQLWSSLAISLRAQGKRAEAEEAYRRAITLKPDHAIAHHNLGALLAEMDRAEEALQALDRAEALGLKSREVALNRGHALLKLYRLPEAEAAYAQAVALDPLDVEAHRNLARLRFMIGDPAFARDLDAVVARRPDAIALRMLFAETLRDIGELQRAENVLRDVLRGQGASPHVRAALATVLLDAGRAVEAREEAAAAVAAFPAHPAIVENLVVAQLMLGEADEALPWIRKFRQSLPNEQRWIAYEATAERLRGGALYNELYDYDAFVRCYELEPPPGWSSIREFNADLQQVLAARHRFAHHPLHQSLRHGSQTARSLIADEDPLIRKILAAFAEPLAEYARVIGQGSAHPLTSRNSGQPIIDRCWSVQLRQCGFHLNHIHPEGWISSAYYVEVPPETQDANASAGWIKFGEPKLPTPGCVPERQLQPRPGCLVLFPSYMWHGTNPIQGTETRTTIAFDAVPGR